MIHGKKSILCFVMAAAMALLLACSAAAAEEVQLSDDASDFVLLSEAVPDAILEIRYYSTYNFVGDRIDGYEEPLALLTTEAAAALKEVSDDVMAQGYRLKIYDAYRPQEAVTNFMNWALDSEDIRMKEYFYPELEKDVLFPQGYIAEHSGHSRGSTVDLTLFDMKTEKEVDMGGTFDYFGELSHPDYTGITEEQFANRMILRDAMLAHGFKPLEEEWWHFTLADEPYPDTYFTFPVNSDSVETTVIGLANPWTDASVKEIEDVTGFALVVPDGVECSSRYMEGMAQASWNWKGVEVTERISHSDGEPALDTDTLSALSGIYFTGATQSKELTVGGRCPGYMEFTRGDAGAVMWYDGEAGLVYTLSFDKVADPKYLGDTAEWITPLQIDGEEDSLIVIDGCAIAHDLRAVPLDEITDDSEFLWKVVDGYGITYTDANGVVWGIYRAGQAGVFEIVVSSEEAPSPWTVGDQIWVGGSKIVELCVENGKLTHVLTDELQTGPAFDAEIR